MSKIKNIVAREILDSRGNPTVEVDVFIGENKFGRAASPSGASVGMHEVHELRDNDPKRFFGKGVEKAVKNINTTINDALKGQDCLNQHSIDRMLVDLDGTKTRSVLGGNAIVATSMAVLKAAALSQNKSLFSYINNKAHSLPVPMINIINGGAHADNALDIQEFMIMPVGAKDIKDAIRMGAEVFASLREVLSSKKLSTSVGDEGGFAPNIKYDKDAIELILRAIEKSGYKAGKDIMLALDVAATELYKGNEYYFEGVGKSLSVGQLVSYYEELSRDYPIYSIEDAMAEEDYEGWKLLTNTLGGKVQLVGDDVFVTNKEILSKCISKNIGNAILIKPNQVGTVTETFETIKLAHSKGYKCIMSHRSGETEDTTISHLAVAMGCSQIKIGSVCRVDRTAKYNELLRINEELGAEAKYHALKQFDKVLT
ncbi:MAG: phosphopyruvate hydratase [Alphaproteobacteria bacterium]|nr:phosphopyruvate hydratase [Alphaproteobacteria bacterium]